MRVSVEQPTYNKTLYIITKLNNVGL